MVRGTGGREAHCLSRNHLPPVTPRLPDATRPPATRCGKVLLIGFRWPASPIFGPDPPPDRSGRSRPRRTPCDAPRVNTRALPAGRHRTEAGEARRDQRPPTYSTPPCPEARAAACLHVAQFGADLPGSSTTGSSGSGPDASAGRKNRMDLPCRQRSATFSRQRRFCRHSLCLDPHPYMAAPHWHMAALCRGGTDPF